MKRKLLTEMRRLRLVSGIGLVDMASEIGLSPTYISLVENKKLQPSDRLIKLVADALQVKPDDLCVKKTIANEREVLELR